MMKWLVVLLVVGVGLWMLTARLRGPRRDDAPPPPGAPRDQAPAAMVACAHCGLHLPAGDALPGGEHVYCSDAHRRLGPAPPGA